MVMEVSIKDGRICHEKKVRKRLERAGDVWIFDVTYDFGLDFVDIIVLPPKNHCESNMKAWIICSSYFRITES